MNYQQYPQPVGTCLRCRRPCYPPHFVAYPSGPMHLECVQAGVPAKPRSKAESIAIAVVCIIGVFGFGTCVCVRSVQVTEERERKEAEGKANAKRLEQEEANRDHVSIGSNGYARLDHDPTKNVFIFGSQETFDEYSRAESKNDDWGKIEALKGAFFVEPNTEVTVLGGSVWTETSEVRILTGKHIGRRGVTYTQNVHRWRVKKSP